MVLFRTNLNNAQLLQGIKISIIFEYNLKLKTMTTIQKDSILKATSVCDSNCVWFAKVIERKGNFIVAVVNNEIVRKKVNVFNGEEYVYLLGKYSMAPIFKIHN